MLLKFHSENGTPFLLNAANFKMVAPLLADNLERGSQITFINTTVSDTMQVKESVNEIYEKLSMPITCPICLGSTAVLNPDESPGNPVLLKCNHCEGHGHVRMPGVVCGIVKETDR